MLHQLEKKERENPKNQPCYNIQHFKAGVVNVLIQQQYAVLPLEVTAVNVLAQ